MRELSPLEIVRGLIPGSYATSFGNPDAAEHMRQFVGEVRRRVPELRGRKGYIVEATVIEAVEWVADNVCKVLDYRGKRSTNYFKEAWLLECSHPATGRFYMVLDEEGNGDYGCWYFGFSLTRYKREARKLFRELAEEFEREA